MHNETNNENNYNPADIIITSRWRTYDTGRSEN